MGVAISIVFIRRYRPMCALPDSVGEAVGNKPSLEQGNDDRAEGMMNHPIPEWRCRHKPRFRIAQFNDGITTRSVAPFAQLTLQLQEFRLKIGKESGRTGLPALTLHCPASCGVKCGETRDPVKQIVMSSRHDEPSASHRSAGRCRLRERAACS